MALARVVGIALALWLRFDHSYGGPAATPAPTNPTEVFQGNIVELMVPGLGLAAVEGRMGKTTVPFYLSRSGDYAAIVGADLDAKPGPVIVFLKSTTTAGEHRDSQLILLIKPKSFKQVAFSVAAAFDRFSPATIDRIRQDQAQFSRAFMTSAPARLWEGPFLVPVSREVSSPFGFRRVINGTPRAPHSGVDLRAALGTDVVAANNGRVALLGDFFFSGQSLVLDHGGGLYTMYFHLSAFKVAIGADVRKGDVIGLSGMTGRVTGPHLHWGARLNGARVDPFELLNNWAIQ